jgi:pimeloyl-ACP methyl ester carboxylesterase
MLVTPRLMITSTSPRERSLRNLSPHGFHRVVWYEWGDASNPRVAICVHGLTRTGRDFDVLAEALSGTHRVLAVDMPGRGRSAWLADKSDYGFPVYLSTLTALVAASGAERVDWIGTSMGGLLGIVMASMPDSPVARLVVNDVGPVIDPAGLARIAAYVGADPVFATRHEIAAYVRSISPFGPLTAAQWDHVVDTVVAERSDGRFGFVYDPGIAEPFRKATAAVDLWPLWDAIRCPALLLRGAASDVLSRPTAQAMTDRGPRPRLVEFEGVAHAPMLMAPGQVDTIVGFLRE